MGSFSPSPIFLHLSLGNGLDTPKNLLVIKLHCRDPAGVEVAAHVTHFVWPLLKGGDSATDICRQEVIPSETILSQLVHNLVNLVYPTVEIPRVIAPVEFGRRANYELWEIDPIYVGRIFDIEKGPVPIFT
jgi:hypothetical protein